MKLLPLACAVIGLAWPAPEGAQAQDQGRRAARQGSAPAESLQPREQDQGLQALRRFMREVQSGQGRFTQTVISPDGQRRKTSSGRFEFQRPDRFRFAYEQPYEQLIVCDGIKLWLHDPDLNQVTVRNWERNLAGTPASLLASRELDRDFDLKEQERRDGLSWVLAVPRRPDGPMRQLLIGLGDSGPQRLEIVDALGQQSVLLLQDLKTGMSWPAEHFRFTPPPGAEVVGR